MAEGAARAVGDRSVSVGGSVENSQIITGDNNLILNCESVDGALLEYLRRALKPSKRLRPRPVREIRPPFQGTVDRDDVVMEILEGVASGKSVNLYGPEGVGKTYAILRTINAENSLLAGDVVYLYAKGPLEDVLQQVFETWYEYDDAAKPPPAELRRDLVDVMGVLALDSVTLGRDDAQQLVLSMPKCRIVACSRERVLWEGVAIELPGLDRDWATAVIEQELGRGLTEDELGPAARIIDAFAGSPLRVREAIGEVRAMRRSLAEIADLVSPPDALAKLAHEKLQDANGDRRRLLATLALFGGAPLSDHNLRAIAGIHDFDAVLGEAVRRNDVVMREQGYVPATSVQAMRKDLDVAAAGDRALTHLTAWAEQLRGQPSVLREEGEALLALLRWAVASGRQHEAIQLGRSVDHAFALGRRFGAWKEVLDLVLAAARDAGDRRSEAWARHQLGTRLICLGEFAAGIAALDEAIRLRRELDEDDAADLSVHNRGIASRSRRLQGWLIGHSLVLVIALLGFLALMGGVVAVALQGGAHPYPVGKAALIVEVTGDGHVGSRPAGVDCPTTCGAHFRPSTPVSLTAVANGRASFLGWRGACSGRGLCIISDVGTKTVFARFVRVPPPPALGATLTVRIDGAGAVRSIPSGIDCPGTCTARFRVGQSLLLTATPSSGSVFRSWIGDCAGAGQCRLQMDANRSVAAEFSAPTLTVTVSGAGSLTSEPAGIDCPAGRCSSSFTSGTTVTLTPHPGKGEKFVTWTGDCTGPGACTLPMTADHTAGAEFSGVSMPSVSVMTAGSGTGTVLSADHKIDCGSTCSASFPGGSVVTLTELASSGSIFAGWSGGGCSGTAPVCKVTVGSSQDVTASFSAGGPVRYGLTVSTTGSASGTIASADGTIDCSSSCSGSYPADSVVMLSETPATGALFVGWSGGGCSGTGSSCAVTMTANQAVTLTFNAAPPPPPPPPPPTTYALTVDNAGKGYGSVTSTDSKILCRRSPYFLSKSTCTATYSPQATVVLNAEPYQGDTFVGWSGGGCSGTGSSCSVTMSSAQTVTATFGAAAPRSYTLTVEKSGTGSGIVVGGVNQIDCGAACSYSYSPGSSVVLSEKPHGSTFEGWSGAGCSGTGPTCTLSMTSNQTVTAMFDINYSLLVTVNGPGTVSSSDKKISCPTICSGLYGSGTSVQLTASPSSGATFSGWSNGCGPNASCTVDMGSNQTVTAKFTANFQ